jgi:hypothetical protein
MFANNGIRKGFVVEIFGVYSWFIFFVAHVSDL